jgi:hypothetical protein
VPGPSGIREQIPQLIASVASHIVLQPMGLTKTGATPSPRWLADEIIHPVLGS